MSSDTFWSLFGAVLTCFSGTRDLRRVRARAFGANTNRNVFHSRSFRMNRCHRSQRQLEQSCCSESPALPCKPWLLFRLVCCVETICSIGHASAPKLSLTLSTKTRQPRFEVWTACARQNNMASKVSCK